MTCKDRILSNNYADVIIDYVLPEEELQRLNFDYCFSAIDEEFGTAYISRQELPPLSVGMYGYSAIPKLYGLMQTFQAESLVEIGNLQMQGPPLSLNGTGVIIGFIDTGIRYNMDAFKNESGGSRILSIWDQTIQSGEPPEGFLYGTEYTREEIDRALQSQTPLDVVSTTDENGHGTAMASTAAGSILGQGLTFRGAAPEVDIAVVKLKGAKRYLREYYLVAEEAEAYQENDIMQAVRYLERMAIVFRRPVVIVLGIGTNMGDHAGNSPLGSYLNKIASKRSRAVVVCGGNEGDKEHHYSAFMPEEIELRVEENTKGFCMELWGNRIDIYSVALRTPGGEVVSSIDFRSGIDNNYTFLFDRTQIYTGLSLIEKFSGNEMIFFRFQNPTPGIWTITVTPASQGRIQGSGRFHLWLPIEEFIDGGVRFLEPDPNVTLTEPSNAQEVITVSAYNGVTGSWFSESGRGFASDGTIKPDFSAPGVQVASILGNRTGSSMAAALTAGCVAQFMEWAIVEGYAPFVESRTIKSNLIRGAVRESNVTYPDERWGDNVIIVSSW